MIGTRVEYRGSVEDAWGRYVIAEEVLAGTGTRYTLATYAGDIALHDVRPTSVTPIPDGPKHRVTSAELRAQIVQGEFARQYPPGYWLPYIHDSIDTLPRRISALIKANRPVEAEYELLQAEKFVGCINYATMQKRMDALVIAGDDESWMPQTASRVMQNAA